MKRENINNRTGFTLLELLTTITVIAILLGLLIPALIAVEKSAMKVKQKAQFHGLEVSLEAFATDMGDYPPSAPDVAPADGFGYGYYSPSQRLAEAMIGRDGLGFHPSSLFRDDGLADMDNDGSIDNPVYDATVQQNVQARTGPYLELESANAVMLSDLYGAGNHGALVDSYVLADMYKITKNAATGKMTGSPVLYYRANQNRVQHDDGTDGNGGPSVDPALNQCTYNVYDSIGSLIASDDSIADLLPLSTKTGVHPLVSSGLSLFYSQTLNPNFPGDSVTNMGARPYRSESFILQSAGADGLYGTEDDVFNFDQEK